MKNLSLIFAIVISTILTSCKDKSEDPKPMRLQAPTMQTDQTEFYGKYYISKINGIDNVNKDDSLIINESSFCKRNQFYDNTNFPNKTIGGVGYDIYNGTWEKIDSFVYVNNPIQMKKIWYDLVKEGEVLKLKTRTYQGEQFAEASYELLKVQ